MVWFFFCTRTQSFLYLYLCHVALWWDIPCSDSWSCWKTIKNTHHTKALHIPAWDSSNATSFISAAICSFEFSSWHVIQFAVQIFCDEDCVAWKLSQQSSMLVLSHAEKSTIAWIKKKEKRYFCCRVYEPSKVFELRPVCAWSYAVLFNML